MANGTYKEKLICGGELTVKVDSWFIEYYFPGPDRRYKGRFFKVAGDKVAGYIDAFEINWEEFHKLKASLPKDSKFEKDGLCGMKIRVGGYFEGVSLAYHYLPIKTEEKLHEIISGYRYALSRASHLQSGAVTMVKEHYRNASVVSSHSQKLETYSTLSGSSYKDQLLKYELENGVPYSDNANVVSSHPRKLETYSTVSGSSYKDQLLKYELENGVPYSDNDSLINKIASLNLVVLCTINGDKVFDIEMLVGLPHFEKYVGDIKDCYNREVPLLEEHQSFLNLFLPKGVYINLSCEAVNYLLIVQGVRMN